MRTELYVQPETYFILSAYLLLMPFHWVAGMLLAAFVHELGHCLAVWLLDIRILRICIGPFGARIETQPMTPAQTVVCALAGPCAGLLVVLFIRVYPAAAVCAAVQTLFNLMPIYPLDGGRALRALRRMDKEKSVANFRSSVYNNPD